MANQDSAIYTNIIAKTKNNNRVDGGRVRIKSSPIVVTIEGAGETYRLFQVHSGDRVTSIRFYSDGAAAGMTDCNLGVFESTGTTTLGTVVDENLFVDAIDLDAAVLTANVESVFDQTTEAEGNEAIWELLGLTEDPNVTYDVVLTAITATTVGGVVGVIMQYVDGS